MRELALFAGAGGGILGGKLLGWTPVCAVEYAPYPRSVLLQRQADGHLPRFPIWDDVRTFDGTAWRGHVDIITGGFPCQDISSANTKGKGIKGERSGLWKEMARIIGEVQPAQVLIENSPNLRTRGLGLVLGDLAGMGYDAVWGIIGAYQTGAPHYRKRMWILAHAGQLRCNTGRSGESLSGVGLAGETLLAHFVGRRRWRNSEKATNSAGYGQTRSPAAAGWPPESGLVRVADGIPDRVDRIRALGNAQVPRVVALAYTTLNQLREERRAV